MPAKPAPLRIVPSRTALVTGGAGFIGHHLVRALCAGPWRVRVVDDLSRGSQRRLDDVADRIEFIRASVLDAEAMQKAVDGADVIFHQAAWAGVPQSVQMPLAYHENNATGTLELLEAARVAGVKRFIYAASSSAYGDKTPLPKQESMSPAPISPYAAAKYAGELYVQLYAQLYGVESIRLRYFNVFGPEQDPSSQYGAAIPAIVNQILRGQPPTLFGDGEQTRDFCYVDNVVHANLLAADAPRLGGAVVNIACGQRIGVKRIVELTNKILGTQVDPVYAPRRPGDVKDSWADITEASRLIGYAPSVYFEEGLRRSIEWYRNAMTLAR